MQFAFKLCQLGTDIIHDLSRLEIFNRHGSLGAHMRYELNRSSIFVASQLCSLDYITHVSFVVRLTLAQRASEHCLILLELGQVSRLPVKFDILGLL